MAQGVAPSLAEADAARISSKLGKVIDSRIKDTSRAAYHRSSAKLLAFFHFRKPDILTEHFQPPGLDGLQYGEDLPPQYFAYVNAMLKSADRHLCPPIRFAGLEAKDFMEWIITINEQREKDIREDDLDAEIADVGAEYEER